jgi:hypothetical protein
MTAAHAAQTADLYADLIANQARWMSGIPDPWAAAMIELHIAQALNDGMPVMELATRMPPQPRDARLVREIAYGAQDAAVRRLWMRNRIAYAIDADLWEDLAYTSLNTELPGDLFTMLPHPDPFVALPKPLILPIGDGKLQQRIEGFFVTGRGSVIGNNSLTSAGSQVSTHSPGAVGNIGLLIVGLTESLSGKPFNAPDVGRDAVMTRVTLRHGVTTLADHITDINSRFDYAPYAVGGIDELAASLTACVSALIYLCAKNAEMRPVPGATIKRAVKGLKGKPPKVIEVGYETGPKLRAYKQREQAERGPATGRTVKAHIRRGHFHTFRVGAGRAESIVKWLAPFAVGTREGDATKTTVVDVA